jgi:hypothetical protein
MKRGSILSVMAFFVLGLLGVGTALAHHHEGGDDPKCAQGEVVVVHKDGTKQCVKETEVAKSCPGGGSAMRDCRTYGRCVYVCADKSLPR